MICRPVAIYLHTSIGDTRLQLNQIVKKQFSSYDMSVKEISLFGIRHFPILLLVAPQPKQTKEEINHQPSKNQILLHLFPKIKTSRKK